MFLDRVFVNSSRVHLERWNEEFALDIPSGCRVLDAGAGDAPYAKLFSHTNYETADHAPRNGVTPTYLCDLTEIPVEDGRFDFVICNQVLEHVPEPKAVLSEFNRVLARGGFLLLTAPFFYEEHEIPRDYYRYTCWGLIHLLKSAGFKVCAIEWMEGYLGTVAYQMKSAGRWLPTSPRHLGGGIVGLLASPFMLFLKCVCLVASAILYRIDIRHAYTDGGYPKNWVMTAQKPG